MSVPSFPRHHPVIVLSAGLGLLVLAACSAVTDQDVFQTAEVNLSPMAALVAPDSVMNSAFAYVDQHPGTFVVPVDGDDMLPRYPKGTALIVYPTDFTALKRGMTVVYAKSSGGRIAHVLTLHTAEGWAARGFNAKEDDLETITEKNYLGTVTMAFAPSSAPAN